MIDQITILRAISVALANPHDLTLLRAASRIAEHATTTGGWWRPLGVSNNTGRFSICGMIDDGADEFIDAMKKHRSVRLEFDSGGGDASTGAAVASYLRTIDSEAIVSTAMSSAAIMAVGCRRVGIRPDGRMLIHAPRAIVCGTSARLRDEADKMDAETTADFRSVLLSRAKIPAAVSRWLGGGDHEFNAEQAIDAGLADFVTEPTAAPVASSQTEPAVSPGDDRFAMTLARCLRQLRVQDRAALSNLLAPMVQ